MKTGLGRDVRPALSSLITGKPGSSRVSACLGDMVGGEVGRADRRAIRLELDVAGRAHRQQHWRRLSRAASASLRASASQSARIGSSGAIIAALHPLSGARGRAG